MFPSQHLPALCRAVGLWADPGLPKDQPETPGLIAPEQEVWESSESRTWASSIMLFSFLLGFINLTPLFLH